MKSCAEYLWCGVDKCAADDFKQYNNKFIYGAMQNINLKKILWTPWQFVMWVLCILRLNKKKKTKERTNESYILLKTELCAHRLFSGKSQFLFYCVLLTKEWDVLVVPYGLRSVQSDILLEITLDWWHWLSVLWYDKLEFISFLYSNFWNIMAVFTLWRHSSKFLLVYNVAFV